MIDWFTAKYYLTHPKDAVCDLGISGCDLHVRTGFYTPIWKRFKK